MNINAKAVFFAGQAALPTMIAQKRGVIVNLASMAGKVGSRANLPYNASKAAVISITKSLALAHAADGIRVNCVCPGFVETDMWASLVQELAPSNALWDCSGWRRNPLIGEALKLFTGSGTTERFGPI